MKLLANSVIVVIATDKLRQIPKSLLLLLRLQANPTEPMFRHPLAIIAHLIDQANIVPLQMLEELFGIGAGSIALGELEMVIA